jgi:hypothetical protein
MKYFTFLFVAIVLLAAPLQAAMTAPVDAPAAAIPTISIVSVERDVSVTIRTHNFPANQTFTARMGAIGTRGVNGTIVGTTNSGEGGSFVVTYEIPAALRGSALIAIRLESPAGYFAYNWFTNTTADLTTTPVMSTPAPAKPVPTFTIVSVVRDQSVTIRTANFPANQTFTARMGPMGTRGVGGTVVGTTSSGTGGSFVATYDIPSGLRGADRIAIRLDSPAGYFSYNWFYNNTANITVTPATPTPGTPPAPTPTPGPVYSGIPTFTIVSVTANQTVSIRTNNFPPNQTFTARMGAMGTRGVGGTVIGTLDSGAGGTMTATFDIPASFSGAYQIAIRLESPAGYFAYNWFYNSTTP